MKSMIKNIVGLLSIAAVLPLSIHAAVYPITPSTDVVGEMQVAMAKYEDSFITLAAKYNVGFEELVQANPHLDPWIPGADQLVVIPTRYVLPPRSTRKGIIINLAELRLYYFTPDGSKVYTYPVGIGRMQMDWKTPLGRLSITQKQENANWYVPQSIKEEARLEGHTLPDFIPPGPDNPMGKHKMRLSNPSYLIHGTNKEVGIGRRVSHGCINMFNDDVAELYRMMPIGTEVNITHQPYKVGWKDQYLWLETHNILEDYEGDGDYSFEALRAVTQHAVGSTPVNIDWSLGNRYYTETLGVPMVIGKKA
jgi:L,D-transpeptidase ErfK/SrfK